jgi:hypothetical protein
MHPPHKTYPFIARINPAEAISRPSSDDTD